MTPAPALALVVDTSVAVKWVVASDGADLVHARSLRDAHVAGRCLLRAPELLVLEFANALKAGKRLSSGEVTEALRHLCDLDLDLRPLKWNLAEKAVKLSSDSGTTVYDAYFLAMALEEGKALVTADANFYSRTQRYGSIILLRDLKLPN